MLEKRTRKLLYQFHIGPQYRGFHYFLSAVPLLNRHPDYLESITKCLYPEIARMHSTSPACVERDLRTIIEIIWKNGCRELFEQKQLLSESQLCSEKRPTNTQFFGMLMVYLDIADVHSLTLTIPNSCKECPVVVSLKARVLSLEQENQWMHDLIWQLFREKRI